MAEYVLRGPEQPEYDYIFDSRQEFLNMYQGSEYNSARSLNEYNYLIERQAYSKLGKRCNMERLGKIIIVFNYFCKKLHLKPFWVLNVCRVLNMSEF